MQFNPGDGSGLVDKIYFLTSSNSTSFPIAQITLEANNALDRVESLILGADGRWQFDDINNTDLPIATTAIVSGQQDYSLATTHLQVTRVEIKDVNGVWRLLTPIDQNDANTQSLGSLAAVTGVPLEYDKIGNSFFLYPTPNYSQTASLKMWFKRPMSYFTTADTTKNPGFNILFHDLIALWPAYNFALANGKQNANQLFVEIQRKEGELIKAYAKRDKDDPDQATMRNNWGESGR